MKTAEEYLLHEALERALEKKRTNFILDYSLNGKAALVWQCLPEESTFVDVNLENVRIALGAGAKAIADDGWWYGFNAGRNTKRIFDGIATRSEELAWANEAHTDGHLIAGVWNFPETEEQSGPVVADFFINAFRDFSYTANNIYEATGYSSSIFMTCTMLQAHTLPMVRHQRRAHQPAKRTTLRWPLFKSKNITELGDTGRLMSDQFLRIYDMAERPYT